MANSLNKATVIGNVGKDPEIRSTQSGGKIANLTVATSESWKDKQSGEKKEKTEWHKIAIFNPFLVGIVESSVKKGSKVYIEGAIQTRKWTDQQGQDRYSTEIVLQQYGGTLIILNAMASGDGQAAERPAEQRQAPARQPAPQPGGGRDLDDDIPFAACWQ